MILLLLALMSLSVIYFARLFARRKMRVTAVSVIALYCCLVVWGFLIFVVNAGGLDFNKQFVSLEAISQNVPGHAVPALKAIVFVAGLTVFSSLAAILHSIFSGVFAITKAVIKAFKSHKKLFEGCRRRGERQYTFLPVFSARILLLNCRLNC